MPKQINNAVYDERANTWWNESGFLQGLHALNPGRFEYLQKLLDQQGIDPQQTSVVDIGCGGGYASEHMAKMGMRVIGVDPSKGSLSAAKEHASQTGLNIDYRHGSGEALPLEDNSCDIAFCCDVLEHVDDVGQVIKEIYRVLKPGGLFFFDTINRTTFSWVFLIKLAQDIPFTRMMPKDTHVWHMFIKPGELKEFLLNAGFSLQELTGFSPKFYPKVLINTPLLWLKNTSSKKREPAIQFGQTRLKAGLYMGWAQK